MKAPAARAIGTLLDGPLDVVGDVHGELDALHQLLRHLGYSEDGSHALGRKLVFVGDLGDRGHNSPAVFLFVNQLVDEGKAQCVLGNHELNLLRKAPKEGNGWFHDQHKDHADDLLSKSVRASPAEREKIAHFLDTLPLALERKDLRVVHACWHDSSIEALRATREPVIEAYNRFEDEVNTKLTASGVKQRGEAEEEKYAKHVEDKHWADPVMLHDLAEYDAAYQMGNPVRVVTSGMERPTHQPFVAGKWRFVERVRWWDEYQEEIPVIIGHYWRWRDAKSRTGRAKDGPDLFDGVPHHAWVGPRKNVFCVDFSVGHRYKERSQPAHAHASRLAAMRWPERTLVFDDGNTVSTQP